jgi:hypothetical protein
MRIHTHSDSRLHTLGFKSSHPGGAHVVMDNASVHFLLDSIGGNADGRVFSGE